MVRIEEATEATPELVEALAGLVPQLSTSSPPPTAGDIAAIVASDASILLIARDAETGAIVGTLCLVVFRIPTGTRAWIEDVIVDADRNGEGIGTLLNRTALDRARAEGARTVDLTSRPSREAANHVYRKIGFESRETNVWRLKL